MTPKGEYFLRYLTKIVEGEWTEADFNQHYEDTLEELCKLHNVSRFEAVAIYYQYLRKMKEIAESFAED